MSRFSKAFTRAFERFKASDFSAGFAGIIDFREQQRGVAEAERRDEELRLDLARVLDRAFKIAHGEPLGPEIIPEPTPPPPPPDLSGVIAGMRANEQRRAAIMADERDIEILLLAA